MWRESWFARLAAAFLFIATIMFNVKMINPAFYLPPLFSIANRVFRIEQHWMMFAPQPEHESGYYVARAVLHNGETADLLRGAGQFGWERPRAPYLLYKNASWRKYLMLLTDPSMAPYRKYYARFLVTDWNRRHRWDNDSRIKKLELWFVSRMIPPPEAPLGAYQRRLLWRYDAKP